MNLFSFIKNLSSEKSDALSTPITSSPTKSNELFEKEFVKTLKFSKKKDNNDELINYLTESQLALKKIKLNRTQISVSKAFNSCFKLFSKEHNELDRLLSNDQYNSDLLKKYTHLINLNQESLATAEGLPEKELINLTHLKLYQLQKLRLEEGRQKLALFSAVLENKDFSEKQKVSHFNQLPSYLQQALLNLFQLYNSEDLRKNLDQLLVKEDLNFSLIDELLNLFSTQIDNYQQLIDAQINGNPSLQQTAIAANNLLLRQLFKAQPKNKETIYNVSSECLTEKIPAAILSQPIHVTMVGVEYAGLIKQGGLAEAIEGLSRGIKEQNPGNQVNLIFPKYNSLPKKVLQALGEPQVYQSRNEQYNVYTVEIDGVTCRFIEHPSFNLEGENPNIYGPDYESQATRFASFSALAADLIYDDNKKGKKTDIVHLHDWHVAGVALKLKRDHKQEWEEGSIPPILFTFHNNNRSAQGRVIPGIYNYSPVVKGFQDAGIIENNENLFIKTLTDADAITTVSETFGNESQQIAYGEGISFAVKEAAKLGKLTGIINGTNPYRWNPETDPVLGDWRDIDSQEAIDLRYGPDHRDLIGQKEKCKGQLQKWVNKYFPHKEIDFSKPLVTYIGRFDSYQKGLDKFEEAIEATLKYGGQFICMGMGEDEQATQILDMLEKKYDKQILLIRDYKNKEGRLHFQQGDNERPGIGPLIRASADFIFAPSRFEPCGLVQFEGWLFGALAIGSKTGGFADTIIPLKQSEENLPANLMRFNGFLFQRDAVPASEKQSTNAGFISHNLTDTIHQALDFWQSRSHLEKNSLISRLIKEGRQYGWTTSPKGFSPAEKYRFAYENAKKLSYQRHASSTQTNRIEALKRRILVTGNQTDPLEEPYLAAYYSGKKDSQSLEILYHQLNEGLRVQVPSPYAMQVDNQKHQKYGAFYTEEQTQFSVFAPNAKQISVTLVDEEERILASYPLQKEGSDWNVSVPLIQLGQKYYYQVDGQVKIDPFGRLHQHSHLGQHPFSIVTASKHSWEDSDWMVRRQQNVGRSQPMSIYELHPTTWKKENGKPLNYRDLAKLLVEHCGKMGYSHVELMGILEHPNEGSWGYQVTGYFSPNSRMGTIDDFKSMVDELHKNNIGVILDWVPAHFASDDFGLANFDGSNLYEARGVKYELSVRRHFFKYGGRHFDYSKKEVREFLLSSASYWLEEMHLDGLRVDCVRSMLNSEDKESACLFLRDLNAVVHNQHPGALTFAEEFSGDMSVTAPYHKKGLAFDFKWHAGWMHHTLTYFSHPLQERAKHYLQIKQAVMSDNAHRQVMFFSHDQVNDGVNTLINKTPNLSNEELKYANARSLLSLMMCLPGKKLHFMGAEWGNSQPWNQLIGQEKGLLDSVDMVEPQRKRLMAMMQKLNQLYREEKALYELDSNGNDIEWIEDPKQVIHAYRRLSSKGSAITCLHNFTATEATYTVKVPKKEGALLTPTAIFNSNEDPLNPLELENLALTVKEKDDHTQYTIQVPPLTTLMIRENFTSL